MSQPASNAGALFTAGKRAGAPEPLRGNSQLRDAIYALPEKLRIPILLHYMDGYKTDEIAQMLRLPGGTVRSRLRRGRTMLKTILEDPEGGCDHE